MAGKGAVAAIAISGLFFIGLIVFLAYYYRESLGLTSSSTTDSSENITFSSPIPSPAPSSPAPSSPAPSSPAPAPPAPPAPASVTINGETFDPTGYTISSGYIWNRRDISGYTPSNSTNASECRQRCLDRTTCSHFARAESDGKCYIDEDDGTGGKTNHIRGIKKDGVNEYSRPVNIGGYQDITTTKMNISDCVQRCTSNTNCTAWVYRTNQHPEDRLKRTCIIFGDSSNPPDRYREGGVGR